MGYDLDTDQGDGNLESPFPPPPRQLTLDLYYIPYSSYNGITPLTPIFSLLLLLYLGRRFDGRRMYILKYIL